MLNIFSLYIVHAEIWPTENGTPGSVHFGIREQRARVLEAAYAGHPERFRRKPVPPALPSGLTATALRG